MSSAFYPLGMRPVPSSGYNHNSSFTRQYVSWKGTGLSKTPVGTTSGTIRPLTNKDYGNTFPAPFGKPRPIKHARKGAVTHISQDRFPTSGTPYDLQDLDRNINRDVRSSTNGQMIAQMIDNPGSYSVKENTSGESATTNAERCGGVCVYANLYPNVPFLTDYPQDKTQSKMFCCNEERKAKRRVMSASTNLKKNYYTTNKQYLENRCKTYKQRAFNFTEETLQGGNPNAKPGAPDARNSYVANCFPNSELAETSETSIVSKILTICQDQGIISSSAEAKEKYATINTFQALLLFIQGLPQPNETQAAIVYDSVVLNPYTGMPITGPSHPKGCKVVIYKPSNPQFAVEGAVSSSTLNLKKNVETIDTYIAKMPRNELIYKNKTESCRATEYAKNGDHTACRYTIFPVPA